MSEGGDTFFNRQIWMVLGGHVVADVVSTNSL